MDIEEVEINMNSDTLKQNAVYIAVAIFVYLVLLMIRPADNFNPTGIILPTVKQALEPSTKPVQIFQSAPFTATQIADINVEGHSLHPSLKQQQEMLSKASKLTQQAGGDGLVVTTFGYEGAGSDNPAPLAKYVLFGKAIKLNSASD